MNKIFSVLLFLFVPTFLLHAENNDTNRSAANAEHNKSVKQQKNNSNKTTSDADLTKNRYRSR